jgi:hypothetical protein
MISWQAVRAGCRCAAETAITTETSPTSQWPVPWALAALAEVMPLVAASPMNFFGHAGLQVVHGVS